MTNCEWREKIGLYVDGELDPRAEQAIGDHLQGCADCSSAVLEQQALKKAVRVAGKRFTAPPELYASVQKQMQPKNSPGLFARPWLKWSALAASAFLLGVITFGLLSRPSASNATVAQLIDQHVIMLASVNPVDVISTTAHGEAVVSGQAAVYLQSAGTGCRIAFHFDRRQIGLCATLTWRGAGVSGAPAQDIRLHLSSAECARGAFCRQSDVCCEWLATGRPAILHCDRCIARRCRPVAHIAARREPVVKMGYCFPVGLVGVLGIQGSEFVLETNRFASFHASPSFFHTSTTKNSPLSALPLLLAS